MLPAPMFTPLVVVAPGKIISMFAPMLAIFCCKIAFDPWPISVMAMTAATAMMTPRAERVDRILLRRSATSAVRHVAGKGRIAIHCRVFPRVLSNSPETFCTGAFCLVSHEGSG